MLEKAIERSGKGREVMQIEGSAGFSPSFTAGSSEPQ